MLSKLVKKIGRPVALVSTLAMLSGCTGMGAAMSTSNDPRTRLIGTLLYYESSHQDRMEEVMAGREEVNVYEDIDRYYHKQIKIGDWISPPPSYTCRGTKDFNGDGYIGRDELINLGSHFECKEQNKPIFIVCGSTWDNVRGKKITGLVKETSTGRTIRIDNKDTLTSANNKSREMNLKLKKGKNQGIKSYTVKWFVGDKLIPTRTINFFVDYGS